MRKQSLLFLVVFVALSWWAVSCHASDDKSSSNDHAKECSTLFDSDRGALEERLREQSGWQLMPLEEVERESKH
jgi:hypothetical protein